MALQVMPPGFRFHPTDEELVAYYLKRRTLGGRSLSNVIGDLELYKFEPWDLPGKSVLQSRDLEWYFFSPRDKKHKHGSRANRATETGYWKATGKDRKVCSGSRTIGMKKTLVYYNGRAPHGDRTDWVMHEYRMDEDYEREKDVQDPFVLCRIFKKGGPGPRNGEQYGAPLMDDGENYEDAPLPEIKAVPTPNDQHSHDIPLELPPSSGRSAHTSSSDVCDAVTPFLVAEEKDVEVISAENMQPVPMPQSQNVAVASPSVSDAFGFYFDMQAGHNDLDDMLHPSPSEAEILDDMLNLTKGPGMGLTLDSGPSWNYNYESLPSLDYGQWSGDFLELADLDMPLDYSTWHQETDWTTMEEKIECSSEADTGIQIRTRKEQPVVQKDAGVHGLDIASRRVRMQERIGGCVSTDILNPQSPNSIEIQETDGVYRHVGTEPMVYTGYEHIPISEVTIFMPEELGDIMKNSNISIDGDKTERALVSAANSFDANESGPLRIQKRSSYQLHENHLCVQMASQIDILECKEVLQKACKEESRFIPVPGNLMKEIGPSKSSKFLGAANNMQLSTLATFSPSLNFISSGKNIIEPRLPMTGTGTLPPSSSSVMQYISAPCNGHEPLTGKLKGLLDGCPVLGLVSVTSRWVCRLKQGFCSKGCQIQEIQASPCPGTMGSGCAVLFLLGSASALLFCVSRELWRFARFAFTIS